MVWFLWFVGLPLAAGTGSLETIASFGCVLAAGGGCTSCASNALIFWPTEVPDYINQISKSRYIGLKSLICILIKQTYYAFNKFWAIHAA